MRASRSLALLLLLATGCGRDPLALFGPGEDRDGGAGDGPLVGPDAAPGDGALDAASRDAELRDAFLPDNITPPRPDAGLRDAGGLECIRPADCFRLGRPPCNPGERGRWLCIDNTCQPECTAPSCNNDCDCPFELACGGGQCLPLSRLNQCCANPMCQPGSFCVEPDGTPGVCTGAPDAGLPRPDSGLPDASPRDSGVPARDSGVPPPPDSGIPPPDSGIPPPDSGIPPPPDSGVPAPDAGINPDAGGADSGTDTPVGAMCMGGMDCGSFGFCIDQSAGFPDGYCSQACGRGSGGLSCPGDAVCRGFGMGNNICLDGCMSNMDCRMGYACVQVGIQPDRVCFPVPPGSTNPMGAPVGDACTADNDCASTLTCLQLPQGWRDGYCTRLYCDPLTNPCPGGSLCYAFPGAFSACLSECPSGGTQSTCRNGYYCLGPTGQPGVCISN